MKKMLLLLILLCFSAVHSMETKQPNATPEIKLTQKALQNFAREKLLALAKNSVEKVTELKIKMFGSENKAQ